MSKVTISGNVSGTGTFTIASPNSNTDRTLNLPDASGDVVLNSATQTLTNKTLTTPNIDSAPFATVSGTAPLYACRAWVNFNGTGTVAIISSGNVSSITDNGAGNYTVNFTTSISDTNYVVSGTCLGGSTGGSNYVIFGGKNANTSNTKTVGSAQVTTAYVSSTGGNGGLIDHQDINVVIFR
jgi:hypothetical protein